ncbi:unnamed protein product, partial [Meganyctiphanes norvegica]
DKQNEILKLVDMELPKLNESMGEMMQSPLMLSLLAVLWVYGEIPESVTTTEVFMKVNHHLRGKLHSRILQKKSTPNDDSLNTNICKFEEYLQEMAFLTFSRMETIFQESTIALLKDKMQECKLDGFETEILGHYLAARKGRKQLVPIIYYSYKHLRMHEYDASVHVCRVLASGSEEDKALILKQLRDMRFNNIRIHTIAIMVESDALLLAKYGQTIVDCGKGWSEYRKLLTETKINSAVVDMVAPKMAWVKQWEANNISDVAAVVSVLHRTQPDTLRMYFYNQTVLPSFLPSYLCKISGHKLKLQLLLPSIPCSHRNSPKEVITMDHDDSLLAVSHPGAQATLVLFTGYLTGVALIQLPSSLEVLDIVVSALELPLLWSRIPYLTQLRQLGITMRCTSLESVTNLDHLQLPRTLDDFEIELYDADDDHCPDIGCILHRCDYSRIAGRVGRYTLSLKEANVT